MLRTGRLFLIVPFFFYTHQQCVRLLNFLNLEILAIACEVASPVSVILSVSSCVFFWLSVFPWINASSYSFHFRLGCMSFHY